MEALGDRSPIRVEDVPLVFVTQREAQADRIEGASVTDTELVHVAWIVRVVHSTTPVGHQQTFGRAELGLGGLGEIDVVGRQRIAIGVVDRSAARRIEAELEVLTLDDPQLPGAEREPKR